jgi:ATPase subunit of ABC transporter with duplicated ATPase domains
VSLTIGPGDRVGLTGPNGAGKSTLLAVAGGALAPSRGSVALTPADATVGLLDQEVTADPGELGRAFVARRLGVTQAATELEAATNELAVTTDGLRAERYDRALRRWLAIGGADLDQRMPPVLDDLGLDPSKLDQEVRTLSGGEQGRLGLAVLLLAQFDILLLDEPTNNLDRAGIERLEEVLRSSRQPFVIVSHDRRLLENTVSSVIELDQNTGNVKRYEGGWAAFCEERAIARAHAERRFAAYTTEKSQLEQRARTQRQWSTVGVAREKKHPRDNDKTQRDFRIEATEKLASRARRTERAIERLEVVDKPWEPWRLQFRFGEAARSGDLVAELSGVVVRRGQFTLGPLDLVITAGERLHLDGRNGAGKTTLLAVLFDSLPIERGERRLGASVTLGWLDQQRSLGQDASSLLAAVEEATGESIETCRSTLAKFGLSAEHVARNVADLSPGERTRAQLAIFQIRGVNTVVLDEPTNHLDVEAIEQLESALEHFDGTLVVVSHDRAFLENCRLDRRIEC